MKSGRKIGMIGLDTSHVVAFAELLHRPEHPYHVEGGTIVAAYPGGSEDFELSYSRLDGFTTRLRDEFGVEILPSPEAVAEISDAILLESVDGRVHLEQFRKVAPYGKPVFIDKPFTVSLRDAAEIFELAEQHQVAMMSCSSLRYAEGLLLALNDEGQGRLVGMDCYGPMALQPTQPGYFWYGIHMAEMLFSAMGKGCVQVKATSTEHHDVVVGTWADGRIGTIRGTRSSNQQFGALLHREQGSQFVDVYGYAKPYYAGLLEEILKMFDTGISPIDKDETKQIIRFLEAANESRETGESVRL